MYYNFKEYNPVFDTPMKRQQELAIARKIMDLLNKNKYDDLEEFIAKNKNYQDFLKKNNMSTVIKHFGNTLKEEDYLKIIENLRVLTKTKKDFEKDNIKTTTLNDKQFNTYEGEDKTYFIDNSMKDKSIENQMKDLQVTQSDLQTSNTKKNTENLFKELEKSKQVLNPQYLKKINPDLLNEKERELYNVAINHQRNVDTPIRIDINKGIIVDEANNISKIEKHNGEFTVISSNDGVQKEQKIEEPTKQKQRVLTPSTNTIYSN